MKKRVGMHNNYVVGAKFWRGTRKDKAMRKVEYTAFRKSGEKKLNYFQI